MVWKFEFCDMSSWQGAVNFAAYKSIPVLSDYVLLRVSVGGTHKDSKFHQYYADAIAQGLRVGGYFVINPLFSPLAHWVNFHDHLGGRKLWDIVDDVELSSGLSPEVVKSQIKSTTFFFKDKVGNLLSLYSARWFWDQYFKNDIWAVNFRMHFAHYPFGSSPPASLPVNYKSSYLPTGWNWSTNYPVAHQYTSQRKYPTVAATNLDQNAGTQELYDFILSLDPAPDPPPPPPPDPPDPPPVPDPPQDRVVNLPNKGLSMKLIADYLDEPITGEHVLQPWEIASGTGTKTITLNNLPPNAKGVLVRLAVRGTKTGAWVTLGNKPSGPAKFRVDAHVQYGNDFDAPDGPHTVNIAMCPLDGNKFYLSWDAVGGLIRFYAELHGYGFESTPEDFTSRIDALETRIENTEEAVTQRVKNVTITVEK